MRGTSASFWQNVNRPDPIECDVVVVGGGIAGCSTAFWLKSLRPSTDVLVVEKDLVASGASGRNAGFLLQGSSTAYAVDVERLGRDRARRLWNATLQNRNMIDELFGSLNIGFSPSGSCTAAGDEEEAELLEGSQALLVEDGFDARYLGAAEVNDLLGSSGFFGGLVVGSGAVVDPVRLARIILEKAGVRVIERMTVESVVEGRSSRVEVDVGTTVIRANAAVVAVNAYLPLLDPDLSTYVRPVRAQMLATRPIDVRAIPMPVYSHNGYYYGRQLDDGRLLLGGARHLHQSEEVGYSLETTEQLQQNLWAYVDRHFPKLRHAEVERRWAGTMGFSPDGLPVWGRLAGATSVFWTSGFTGHGMSIAFLVGKLLAELVLNKEPSDLATMFSSERFVS